MSQQRSGLFWSRFFGKRERDDFAMLARSYESRVQHALKRVCKVNHHCKPPIVQHLVLGTPAVDPTTLRIIFLFRDDEALAQAQQNGLTAHLTHDSHRALRAEGYPEDALPSISVEFAAKKAVDAVGGPWVYFR